VLRALIEDAYESGALRVGDVVRLGHDWGPGPRLIAMAHDLCRDLSDHERAVLTLLASQAGGAPADYAARGLGDAIDALSNQRLIKQSRDGSRWAARIAPALAIGIIADATPARQRAAELLGEQVTPTHPRRRVDDFGVEERVEVDVTAGVAEVTRLLDQGSIALATRVAAELRAAALEGDDEQAGGAAAYAVGCVALAAGHASGALRLLTEAAALLEESELREAAIARVVEAAVVAGDSSRAVAAYDALQPEPGDVAGKLRRRLAAAWIAAAQRNRDRVHVRMAEAIELSNADDVQQGNALLHLALRLGVGGCPVAQLARRRGEGLTGLYAAHARARLDADADALERVAEGFAQHGASLLAAETFAEAGAGYRAEGLRACAHRSLTASKAALAGCGEIDSPTLRHPESPSSVLTNREEEVAWLAASGASNREIAEQLGLSVRTVEGHLAHAFTALGIASRRQLAGIVARTPT
jgi:DNA-binding CsgD family transcriptional regulator